MACTVCPTQAAGFHCQFSLDTALENIRKHYKTMETSLLEKSKQVDELKERNNKLTKAIDCLKKPNTLALLNSFSEQCDRPTNFHANASQMPLPSPVFEDITIIDDDEEDNALVSVMDTALNGSALNTTINEVITETEYPNPRGHARRLALKLKPKGTAHNKKSNCNNNDENKKPTSISSPPSLPANTSTKATIEHSHEVLERPSLHPRLETKDRNNDNNLSNAATTTNEVVKSQDLQNSIDWTLKSKLGPQTPVNTNKSIIKKLSLKQTRLPFDEKRERSPNAGKPARTLTLGRCNKMKNTDAESDDDVFDFNKSETFQFKSPTPKKSKFNESNTDFFGSPKAEDASVMAIASPTQTVYFLDDTTDEERQEQPRSQPKRKTIDNDPGDESTDSLADFDMNDTNAELNKSPMPPRLIQPLATNLKKVSRQLMPPTLKVKEEPLTQKKEKKAVNAVFNDTDTAEESDDEFMVRPIQVKVEPESKKHIDLDSIKCLDCRNYIKFCGERMTTEKLEEHIRNCVYHNEPNDLGRETPDGFWNPLLVSFDADDPRNEVLVDNRFASKKTICGAKKNS